MFTILLVVWVATFSIAKIIESAVPARAYRIQPGWWWWLDINGLGLILSLLANQLWQSTIGAGTRPANLEQLIGFW